MKTEPRILGVILAAGRARRMGARGKSLIMLGGRPLIAHVYARVRGQVTKVAVNASENFSWDGDGEVSDRIPDITAGGRLEDLAGPLAGILSALDWADRDGGFDWVATFPTDTPFLPEDFTERALRALKGSPSALACAASGGRAHPVVGLWPVDLAADLRRIVVDEGLRRADGILERFRTAPISYPAEPTDPFFNVNTPEDLIQAERILAAGG